MRKLQIVFFKTGLVTIKELGEMINQKLNPQTLRNRAAAAFRDGRTVDVEGEKYAIIAEADLLPVASVKSHKAKDVASAALVAKLNRAFEPIHAANERNV